MAAVHKRLHQEDVVGARRLDHRAHLAAVHAHRLFDQDVLLGGGRPPDEVQMRRMDRGDVDGVERRVGKERVVTVVHGRYVEHPREICRLLPLAAGHGGRPARLREA